MTNNRLRAKLAIALLFASAEGSHAQNLPRQLTMVVPFAAGGPSDVAGRIIAQGLLSGAARGAGPVGRGGESRARARARARRRNRRLAACAPGRRTAREFVIVNSGTHAGASLVQAPALQHAKIDAKTLSRRRYPKFAVMHNTAQTAMMRSVESGKAMRRRSRAGPERISGCCGKIKTQKRRGG